MLKFEEKKIFLGDRPSLGHGDISIINIKKNVLSPTQSHFFKKKKTVDKG